VQGAALHKSRRGVAELKWSAKMTATYSITSSAIASTPDGIARPSVFAVLRLIINSNLVGAMSALGHQRTRNRHVRFIPKRTFGRANGASVKRTQRDLFDDFVGAQQE